MVGNKIKLTEEVEKDPVKYSEWLVQSIGDKAEKNKRRARFWGICSVVLSSVVVFILMFENNSTPALIAAAVTIFNSGILAWMQLEKPYDRWRLYRKFHRLIEIERLKFLNKVEPYSQQNGKEIFLVEMANLQIRLHYEWDGLVPSGEEIQKLQKGK